MTLCAPGTFSVSPDGAHGVTRPASGSFSCRSCTSWLKNSPVFVFVAVLLLTGLLGTKARDPFHRERLSLRTGTGEKFSAMVVMPDRGGPFQVVVWCHGSRGSVESSGETLQQFAAQGLAGMGFSVRPGLRADFDWLAQQPGAKTCCIRDLLEHVQLAAL